MLVKCDICKKEILYPGTSKKQVMWSVRNLLGWQLINQKNYCSICASKYENEYTKAQAIENQICIACYDHTELNQEGFCEKCSLENLELDKTLKRMGGENK
jgi:hypothetical protein